MSGSKAGGWGAGGAAGAARRPGVRALVLPLAVLAACVLAGCEEGREEVLVEQPIAFAHKTHLEYFSSGKHRAEKIQMHLELLEEKEPPSELAEGRCVECHDDLAEKKQCAGCHLLFQDATLRARKDVRACIACHRKAWSGGIASIPSANVCSACHAEKARTNSPEEKKLRELLAAGRDIPWVQLHRTAPNVEFSHVAHVRFGKYACTRCHEDLAGKTAPPTSVTVFTMSNCLECHQENHANQDCLACHR